MLEVRLIGKLEIKCDGKPVIISSRVAQSLFAYLILNASISHRREKLAGMFWPDATEEKARAYLRHELWRIRKTLSAKSKLEYVIADDINISFDPSDDYWLDVNRLKVLQDDASVEELKSTLAVYQGELLPGFYEQWITQEREHLHSIYEHRMTQLLKLLENEKNWHEMIQWAESWIVFGQAPETAYRCLMIAYYALGDRAKVDATYQRCVQALRELDLEPSEETRALAFKRTSRLNLPIPLTSFIGREKELKEIADLFSKSRLVTLTGSGGVGKTRLAIQVVPDLLERFPDGVWFLDLAPLSTAELVPSTLANVIGLRESGEVSITNLLINFFKSRAALVIFDNCEHLIEGCAQLVNSLLISCENLMILSTSREVLRISGEIPYRVPSLEIPTAKIDFAVDEISNIESVNLFIERATAISAAFAISQQNARPIVQICQRLDGIPLAIELASAWVNVLTVEQIARRLDDCFNLLMGGLRSSLPRHQTLRATIEWSYDLLSQQERVLFRRLAVFVGGWTLEAAEKVCSSMGIDHGEVLILLSQLENKSMILVSTRNNEIRYRRLEAISQYAREKLVESGEYDILNTRHRDFFLSLAERAEPHLESGRDLLFWFRELEAERENLRAALDWCKQKEQVQFQAQLACALYVFWWRRGYFIEGYRWIEAPLSRRDFLPKALVGKMLWMASRFALRQGEFTNAKADAERSVALCRELKDKRLLAMAIRTLAMVLDETGEHERANSLMEDTMTLYRELGDEHLIAGQLGNLASGAFDVGDYTRAAALHAKSLAFFRERGDDLEVALAKLGLAEARLAQRDPNQAERWFQEALQELYKLGDKWQVFSCLEGLAAIANARGHYERAAQLLGASEQQATLIGGFRKGYGAQPVLLPAIEAARAGLSQSEFEAAWAEGKAMSLDQVVAYALQTTV